jgi:2-methylisocitrate lyase-like PEP mutase family enzyme
MGLKGVNLTMIDVAALGVKRVSVGSGLARCALGAFIGAAREMRRQGTFNFADDAVEFRTLNSIFGEEH